MSSTTNYLITGANRGLGKGLLKIYLSRPNSTVIAAVRDPEHTTAKALSQLPKADSSNLIVVKIDSASETDALAAVETLKSAHNITSLDVVVANAGIAKALQRVVEATPQELHEHYNVNVVGVIILFQAVLPLLEKSKLPKFVTIGSSAGSTELLEVITFPNITYGTSKAAAHYVTRRIHFEYPHLIAFPICPGWSGTDMGNAGAKAIGRTEALMTVEESVQGIAKVIDEATRETTSGTFINYEGASKPW